MTVKEYERTEVSVYINYQAGTISWNNMGLFKGQMTFTSFHNETHMFDFVYDFITDKGYKPKFFYRYLKYKDNVQFGVPHETPF